MLAVARKLQADWLCSIQTPCCGLMALMGMAAGMSMILATAIMMPEIDSLITWLVGSQKKADD
jgi:hypothetical protein